MKQNTGMRDSRVVVPCEGAPAHDSRIQTRQAVHQGIHSVTVPRSTAATLYVTLAHGLGQPPNSPP